MEATGIIRIRPSIKRIRFDLRAKMVFDLKDGRSVSVPLSFFPAIRKLTRGQRLKWYVTDGELFSFDDCTEVFHIEQVLGRETEYHYDFKKGRAKKKAAPGKTT